MPKPRKSAAEKAAALPSRFEFNKADFDSLLKAKPLPVPGGKLRTQWSYSDTKETGLTLLVSTSRAHERDARLTFRACYYMPSKPGIPKYIPIGSFPNDDGAATLEVIEEARFQAKAVRREARNGNDPRRPTLPDNFESVVRQYIESKSAQKHWRETERKFNRYILPEWKDLSVNDIKTPTVAALLDKIDAKKIKGPKGRLMGGVTTGDRCYADLSGLFKWYSTRTKNPNFKNPITRGMRNINTGDRKRQRKLNGFEVRAFWKATAEMGVYGAAARILLLTGQRLRKVEQMRRSDIKQRMLFEGREIDGEWIDDFWIENVWNPIAQSDAKNKSASLVPLPAKALEIINNVPVIVPDEGDPTDYIFSLARRAINLQHSFGL